MKRYGMILPICLASVMAPNTALAELLETIKGPDNQLAVSLSLTKGKPHYSVTYQGEVFLESSPLGLNSSIGDFSQNLTYIDSKRNTILEQYELDRAKVSQVTYEANGLTSRFRNAKGDEISIIFQVSDNDIALRYRVVSNNEATRFKVLSEATSFNLSNKATTFITHQALPMTGWNGTKPSYEEGYTYDESMAKASPNGVGYTFPALFKNDDKGWVLLSETGVDSHYVGSRLSEGNAEGIYKIAFPQPGENAGIGDTYASMALPATTPWRTITVGKDLEPIVETTVSYDVVKPLYEPSEDYKMGRATWSWIVWQDNSINYEDQIKYIDMAAELNFEYVLIDNWWDARIGREKIEALV